MSDEMRAAAKRDRPREFADDDDPELQMALALVDNFDELPRELLT